MDIDCTFDDGFAQDNALGLIVLQTDETMEVELRRVFERAAIACYHTRIPSHALVTPETLAGMEKDLPAAARLLPSGVNYGAIGYGCTSGATVIGPENVARAINGVHSGTNTTDPLTAAIAALRSLNAKKIAILTPYIADVSKQMRAVFKSEGFEIIDLSAFNQSEDRLIARIATTSTLSAIKELGAGDCDAVFASCTNLRSFDILDEAENLIGKPVVSSNLALAWHMLKRADVSTKGMGPGRLFNT